MIEPTKEVIWKSEGNQYWSPFQNAGYDEDGYFYTVRSPVTYSGISRAYARWFSDATPAEMTTQLRKAKILW